jgi:hypothetical protein
MTIALPFPARSLSALAPLALLLLAGCGEDPAAQPAETQAAAPVAPATPALPAPDEEIFAATFAAACPEAEPVATSSCRSMGLGETDFACEYGLGEDNVLRHDARLTPGEGEWTLVDPETVCTQ